MTGVPDIESCVSSNHDSMGVFALLKIITMVIGGLYSLTACESSSQNSMVPQEVTVVNPSGVLDTGYPVFSWNAVADAEHYRIVVNDEDTNGYSVVVDPVAAGCSTGSGVCSHQPALGYFDNDLNWHVESSVNGQAGPASDSVAITTPASEDVQLIKSNTSSCEGWPAITYDKYVVLNNTWNSRAMGDSSWSQRINVNQDVTGVVRPQWSYDWRGQFDSREFGEFEVKAYPEVIYGNKLGTHISGSKEETGLPELAADIPDYVVAYDFSETGSGAERNVALESFFHDSCNIAGPCDEVDNRVYEMMVWVNNPTIRTPGDLALTGVMIDDKLWDVYIKPRSDKHYIAFTAQVPSTSGTLNWKRFVDWTREWTDANADELEIDKLLPGYCMGAIEIGTEMWWGSGSFTLNHFEVSR